MDDETATDGQWADQGLPALEWSAFTARMVASLREELEATYPGWEIESSTMGALLVLRMLELNKVMRDSDFPTFETVPAETMEGAGIALHSLEGDPLFAVRVQRVRPLLEEMRRKGN